MWGGEFMKLRAVAVFILLLATFGVIVPDFQRPIASPDADLAISAFIARFWDPEKKYFYTNSDRQIHRQHAHGPEEGLYTDFWWEAQLWELVMDTYQRTQLAAHRWMIEDVYEGFLKSYPAFANDFNDDLGWWALASIRAYEITSDARYLARSKILLDSMWVYEDSVYGGGIWWRRGKQDQKNVATNAVAATVAAKLYAITGDCAYLTNAQSIFSWLSRRLQRGGRVYDRITGADPGSVVKADFTYNFGTYIGAAIALYAATGDDAYMSTAISSADWATRHLINNGVLIFEGIDDAGGFKAILIRSLVELATIYGQKQYLPFLKRNSFQAWSNRRPVDNLVGPDWSAPAPGTYLQSLTAAAAVSLLQLVPPDNDSGIVAPRARRGVVVR